MGQKGLPHSLNAPDIGGMVPAGLSKDKRLMTAGPSSLKREIETKRAFLYTEG